MGRAGAQFSILPTLFPPLPIQVGQLDSEALTDVNNDGFLPNCGAPNLLSKEPCGWHVCDIIQFLVFQRTKITSLYHLIVLWTPGKPAKARVAHAQRLAPS